MEYFDFEDAAGSRSDLPDFASDIVEANQDDHNEMVDSLYFDKSFSLPTDPAPIITAPGVVLPEPTSTDQWGAKDDDAFNLDDNTNGVYPLYRPKEPCERCRQMGLECFLAHSGTFVNGCTICISLYRECSFTHKKPPGVYMDTLATLTEDTQELVGGLTGRKTMRSLTYNASTLDSVDRPRKAGARFGREPTKILKTWLAEHARHPYPTEDEKDDLKRRTGLKRSQISNWLANARRRGKVPQVSETSSPVLGAIDIPPPNRNQLDLSELNPFERWKISPPEHEAASASAIAKAIQSTNLRSPASKNSPHPFASSSRQASTRRTSSNDDSTNFSMFQSPSVSSFATARSSMSMSESASHRSVGTSSSLNSAKDRRRRRRNPLATRPPPQKPRGARIFQCTFCTDSFPSKYDWQRHEKSLHLALERWSCAPEGGTVLVDNPRASSNGQPPHIRVCVFCQAPNPSDEHLETVHSFLTCQDKTLQERTFYRKDHLRQHLRLLHDATFHPKIMDLWKSTTSEIQSRCGFCPQVFNTWSQRADHLAAHFKNGSDMKDWEGGWGFEPFVERLVENAMPPYMIGQERGTMDPFVAKRGNTEGRKSSLSPSVQQIHVREAPSQSEMLTCRHDGPEMDISDSKGANLQPESNCWLRIQRHLKSYISDCLSKGLVPSDQDLQRQARLKLFNDDDPWNQTCADNPVWLSVLKRECGLVGDDGRSLLVQGERDFQAVAGKPVSHMTLQELPMNPPYAVRGGLRGPPQVQRQSQMSKSPYPQSSMSSATAGLSQEQVHMPVTSTTMGGWETSSSLPGAPLYSASMSSLGMAVQDEDAMDFDLDLGVLGIGEMSDTWHPELAAPGGVGVPASGTASGGLYTGDFGYGMTSAGSGGFAAATTNMGGQDGYGGGNWYSAAG